MKKFAGSLTVTVLVLLATAAASGSFVAYNDFGRVLVQQRERRHDLRRQQ